MLSTAFCLAVSFDSSNPKSTRAPFIDTSHLKGNSESIPVSPI